MLRRNSDEKFRDLLRKAQDDPSLLPYLARMYERTGSGKLKLPEKLVDTIAAQFRSLEDASEEHGGPANVLDAFGGNGFPEEFDTNNVVAFAIAYVHGVSDSLGIPIEELWKISEVRRHGAGERRRIDRELDLDGGGGSQVCEKCSREITFTEGGVPVDSDRNPRCPRGGAHRALSECDDHCGQHARGCDGYCEHLAVTHVNVCLSERARQRIQRARGRGQ